MDVEAEIRDLQRRVGELEGSFEFLIGQVKGIHRSLLGFQAETKEEFKKVKEQFRKVDGRFDGVDGRLDRLEKEGQQLRKDLPGIVGDAMREVLRERDKR